MILTCNTLYCNLIANQNQNHMTISSLLKGGLQIGLKNFLSLVGALILYTLTIWIPYLNVGTTIAMVSIPAALSRGEIISPTEIFKSKYRKNMGAFFLLMSFMFFGTLMGYLFLIIPGIVLSYSWCIALLLLVDKGLNPMQALNESNKRTYGHKLTIFLSQILLGLGYFVLNFIISAIIINQMFLPTLAALIQLALMLLYVPLQLGILAEVYRNLSDD